jgi:HD superfamily phosphodiesterase
MDQTGVTQITTHESERYVLGGSAETVYDNIYREAKPYLDTRRNEIHVSVVYEFARRLVSCYPEADAEVVLPAVLLHDVGWKSVPEEQQLDGFGPHVRNKEIQRFHEVEGARIAETILRTLNYSEEKIVEIIAIVDGHDTRLQALSLNDSLLKDADKLWRYSTVGVQVDHIRFGVDRHNHLNYLHNMIDRWFFTPAARDMARESLAEARTASY